MLLYCTQLRTAIVLRDGAQVGAGTFGAGDGGNLTVNATDSVQVIGISSNAHRLPMH
ncbi:MAG: hypothetical protein HC862_20430 [Scytonema sp. RU_4_4]|nr:hypothetical protein [Scytonema sp. RU_4_4]